MQRSIICLLLLLLLVACAPAVATENPTPSLTPSKTTTKTPTSTVTETPIPEIFQDLPEDFYQGDYISRFENVHEDVRVMGDEEYQVLLGTGLEDGREQVIGIKIEGEMVRAGEYIDPEGHSIYAYIKPDNNLLGRIQVTNKTPEILFEFFLKSISEGEYKSITGGDIEKMRDIIWGNNGKLKFKVPTEPDETHPLFEDPWAVVWRDLPNEVDFNKPIEITIVGGEEEFLALPNEIQKMIYVIESDEYRSGGLIWTNSKGQLHIYAVDSSVKTGSDCGMYPKDAEQRAFAKKYLKSRVGIHALDTIELLDNWKYGNDAFLQDSKYSDMNLDILARSLFEYIIEPQVVTSK